MADAVEHRTALHDHAGRLDVAETMRVVRAGPDRIGDIVSDLARVNVEGRGNLNVADMVTADISVHQPGNRLVRIGVPIVGQPLDERTRAIANSDNANTHPTLVLNS